ncbi:twitching motility protein PilT [Oceaniferula spumae]|uniref:Twitching motility protein PilT n=1 Tax=Oceaniferula spumae TaxID=2979115 RepID=A0AAT9FGC0_9BACT
MIIADTSIWIHHFRKSNAQFCQLLSGGQIAMHPFILGELSCGNLPARTSTLKDLDSLPVAAACLEREVRELIESRQLMGRGIGYIDAHLLASSLISDFQLWTRDKRLHETAVMLGCSYVS